MRLCRGEADREKGRCCWGRDGTVWEFISCWIIPRRIPLQSCEVCGSARTPPGNWKKREEGRGERKDGQVKEEKKRNWDESRKELSGEKVEQKKGTTEAFLPPPPWSLYFFFLLAMYIFCPALRFHSTILLLFSPSSLSSPFIWQHWRVCGCRQLL